MLPLNDKPNKWSWETYKQDTYLKTFAFKVFYSRKFLVGFKSQIILTIWYLCISSRETGKNPPIGQLYLLFFKVSSCGKRTSKINSCYIALKGKDHHFLGNLICFFCKTWFSWGNQYYFFARASMTYSFILIEKKIKRKTKNLLRQGAISTVATKKKKKNYALL